MKGEKAYYAGGEPYYIPEGFGVEWGDRKCKIRVIQNSQEVAGCQ
ncbi:hypothetical protein [Xenorhabdus mauleonii]|nr:hypothetical protein [Xenorhabdus mauleonii]